MIKENQVNQANPKNHGSDNVGRMGRFPKNNSALVGVVK